jgi:hypothetical protein
MVFLCGGSKPACPSSGTVTGTLTASDVNVLRATNADSVIPQGFQPGDLASAIQSGNTYVNVHTANFPNGEVRGQGRTPLDIGLRCSAAGRIFQPHYTRLALE